MVDFYNETQGRTFKSVKRQYKTLTQAQLSRFTRQVANGGTKFDKFRQINGYVFDQVQSARQNMLPVHEEDLRRWALAKAAEIQCDQFTAGTHWIDNFKHRHGLVSRRVTKVWPKSKRAKVADIEEAANTFRNEVLSEMLNHSSNMIINIDQCGFEYELYSTRTLSFKGERDTPLAINSMNKTTHSYSIQVALGANGLPHGRLFIVLQEKDGQMGPRIRNEYFRAGNIAVSCSSSG